MIYIVTGFMRSGTSMMMTALKAGGMDIAYSQIREMDLKSSFNTDEYVANDNFYEIRPNDFNADTFRKKFEGKTVKILLPFIMYLPRGDYMIINMERNIPAIWQSYLAAISMDSLPGDKASFERYLATLKNAARDRKSFQDWEDIRYEDVIKQPNSEFCRLRDRGWPIDPQLASQVPKEERSRF